jgi:hypothetical protein
MQDELSKLLYGAIGGGLVTLLWSTLDKYWLGVRLGESVEARGKLRLYAKPLWLECRELEFRLRHICQKTREPNHEVELAPLRLSPKEARSLEWYTKEGYYITSTAYLVAAVAGWIRLFQRDVVFLQFGTKTSTRQFLDLVEELKSVLSKSPSVLWYYYFDGIGDKLIDENRR